jgi:hypothetical protein
MPSEIHQYVINLVASLPIRRGPDVFMHTLVLEYQWRTQDFFTGVEWGVQQIQLRTKGKENGDLGAVAH